MLFAAGISATGSAHSVPLPCRDFTHVENARVSLLCMERSVWRVEPDTDYRMHCALRVYKAQCVALPGKGTRSEWVTSNR